MQERHTYVYDGPVMLFGTCITNHWKGETTAPSEGKAYCNLAYQFKKETNRTPNSKVGLPGKLTMIN